ncbi:MAG: phosphoenolpyruvate carboxylase, partial [Bdellovibrionales bacterium]|nr:phosphoenolpyruvate carboxylase [Bdellovibrionales bacterium]
MHRTLNMSRVHFWNFIKIRIDALEKEIHIMSLLKNRNRLQRCLVKIQRHLKLLSTLRSKDGERIRLLSLLLKKFSHDYESSTKSHSLELTEIINILKLFPALVLPIELREESDVINKAIQLKKKSHIEKMFRLLQKISCGLEMKWYARGFVVSMCESENDILAALHLQKRALKSQRLPIIPLFETEDALNNAFQVITNVLKLNHGLLYFQKFKWNNRFEVMLGYSDSAKENGVLHSKILISKTVTNLNRLIQKQNLIPVFFHGSGGSIERGGGSIKEQTAWWPRSALDIFKVTIQGEMVSRTFSTSEILKGQIQKIVERHSLKLKSNRLSASENSLLTEFSTNVQKEYRRMIHNSDFLQLIENISPYPYLKLLKIGSRPSRRASTLSIDGLRAIPWILCWTQMRVLFPVWWGIGSSWKSLSSVEKRHLKTIYKKSALLNAFANQLGFTLKKVELGVWKLYLRQNKIDLKLAEKMENAFENEYQGSIKCFVELTGQKNLLFHRPWLGESIELRSPMIHPLNILQLLAIKRGDTALIRETVTGIACGMLTTG